MGPRPTANHSLDRLNTDSDYSPTNCRWATRKEQARNTRRNRTVTFRGLTLCVAQWAEETGIPKFAIIDRLNRGWNIEDALTITTNLGWHDRLLTYQGITDSQTGWARRLGVNLPALKKRLARGWSVEKAFSVPFKILPSRSANVRDGVHEK